uniref:ral guanine nucleotide dissociation stimulator-like n=1 Tax=Arvicanthis niloticus TaxID=61156 RepID=UPI00148741B8|nr:ral guanine nucleotide dissociation stimulator-like [Arvicanthis niloticus]
MFSCCTRTTRGSGLKKDNREGHRGVWRHRIRSCLRRLWPFSRKGNILPNGNQDQDCTDQDLRDPQREPHISAEAVVKLVSKLVPSLQEGDPFFSPAFLSKYRSFVTPLHVKTLELMSYAFFGPYEEDAQVMNTLCGFLHAWMDKNPEDFCGPTDLFPVRYMEAYWSAFMPHSGLIVNNNMVPTPAEGRTD